MFDYAPAASPASTMVPLLAAGRANDFAAGPLRSSTATSSRGLGWSDDGSAFTIATALYGDADLSGAVDFDDLLKDKRYRSFEAYSQAKLANILFTFQLERFLQNTPATANVMHPGFVASGFGGGASGNLLLRLTRPLAKTPAQGAETAVYLATSPEVEGVSGRYYIDKKPAAAPKTAYDRQVQARLWRRSRELVRLTEAEEAPLRQVTPKSERGFL